MGFVNGDLLGLGIVGLADKGLLGLNVMGVDGTAKSPGIVWLVNRDLLVLVVVC